MPVSKRLFFHSHQSHSPPLTIPVHRGGKPTTRIAKMPTLEKTMNPAREQWEDMLDKNPSLIYTTTTTTAIKPTQAFEDVYGPSISAVVNPGYREWAFSTAAYRDKFVSDHQARPA